MVEEKKKDEAADVEETNGKKSGKSGLMTYLMVGGIFFVVTLAVVAGTLYFIKGSHSATEADGSEAETARTTASSSKEDHSKPDSLLAGDDQSVIDQIMSNLEMLDYQPTEADLADELGGMSRDDSVDAMSWLDKEKALLTGREEELSAREKELQRLERSVSQKMTILEQAESGRVSALAKLYDGMDPRSVAKLMSNLDNGTVVSILPRMKIKSASAVLSLLPAKRAAKLSKQMITIAEK